MIMFVNVDYLLNMNGWGCTKANSNHLYDMIIKYWLSLPTKAKVIVINAGFSQTQAMI